MCSQQQQHSQKARCIFNETWKPAWLTNRQSVSQSSVRRVSKMKEHCRNNLFLFILFLVFFKIHTQRRRIRRRKTTHITLPHRPRNSGGHNQWHKQPLAVNLDPLFIQLPSSKQKQAEHKVAPPEKVVAPYAAFDIIIKFKNELNIYLFINEQCPHNVFRITLYFKDRMLW